MGNKLQRLFNNAVKTVTPNLAFGDYVDIVAPSIYRGGSAYGNYFFGGNGVDYRFMYNGHGSAIKAYSTCPPLCAVINRKAQCYINGITTINNTQGTEAGGIHAKRIRALMKRPNPLQTWRQFEAQQYIYVQLFGFCITLPIMAAGYEELGPTYATSLWNIPPYMVDISESSKLFYQTDLEGILNYIKLDYKGLTTMLPIKNLLIMRDFVPGAHSMVIPDSRVKALEMPINNIIGALLTRNELINYAGAQGILSPEGQDTSGSIPLKEDEKVRLQEDMKSQYGIQRGQWRYIIAPAAMSWSQIGKPTKDLMLFEELVDDIMRICDAFNYPSPLLNSEKGPNVSNTAQYQAQIYEDGIIPESIDLYDQWNNWFRLEEFNLIMVKEYGHIGPLQENKKEQGQAALYLSQALMLLWAQDLVTANEVLDELEMDTKPGWDIYRSDFVKLGKIQPNIQPDNSKPVDPEDDDKDKNDDKDK